MRSGILLLAVLALSACGQSDSDPGPGGVTVGEARALDEAAAMLDERRRPIRTVLQLAQLRGEMDPDLDLDVAVAMLTGPFVQRRMIDRHEVTDEFRDAVLEHVVSGLLATRERATN